MEVLNRAAFTFTDPKGCPAQLPAKAANWPRQELTKYAVFLVHSLEMELLEEQG